MDRLAIIRRRLHGQRVAADRLPSPVAAVRWLGAVQAQEYAEAKWSVGQRVLEGTDADVEAAFTRGEILRTHLLRPTWHFVARDDLRWLLRLTAPRVHQANRYPYRRFGLPQDVLTHSLTVLDEALADGEPRTRPELAVALSEAGIEAEGLRLGYILMHAELEALICSGPRRGRRQTYARFDDRVPAGPEPDREASLAELVLRYFTSRGPATIADFTTWSGLTVADAKAALAGLGDRLERVEDEEGLAWFASPGDTGPHPAAGAFLLPMYDEIVMGYKGLRIVLARSSPRAGLLSRAIVIDGTTVGSWKRSVTARSATIEATLFTPLDATQADALEAAVERFGRFNGVPGRLKAAQAVD